jgi:hypothetical protein
LSLRFLAVPHDKIQIRGNEPAFIEEDLHSSSELSSKRFQANVGSSPHFVDMGNIKKVIMKISKRNRLPGWLTHSFLRLWNI